MPYKLTKNSGYGYSVINTETGKVHSARTSKVKAEGQIRLLTALDKGTIIKKRNEKNLRNIKYKM